MNREIKFRAWDRVKKFMLPPDDMGYQIQMPNGDYFDADVYYMQFTGLKDKNGKEIYEGDIVKQFGNPTPRAIEFFRSAWRFQKWIIGTEIQEGAIEVIGNIYENPELLTPNL